VSISDVPNPEAEPKEASVSDVLQAAGTPSWQEQDELLREMWLRNQTPQAIAESLGRSTAAIMTRAARLGLPRRSSPGRKPGQRHSELPGQEGRKQNLAPARAAAPESTMLTPQTSPRVCLMCLTKFQSLGRHNRICSTCRNSSEYESASSLSDLHFPVS